MCFRHFKTYNDQNRLCNSGTIKDQRLQQKRKSTIQARASATIVSIDLRLSFRFIKYAILITSITIIGSADKMENKTQNKRKELSSVVENGDVMIDKMQITHSINNPPNKPYTNGQIKGINFFIIIFLPLLSLQVLNVIFSHHFRYFLFL